MMVGDLEWRGRLGEAESAYLSTAKGTLILELSDLSRFEETGQEMWGWSFRWQGTLARLVRGRGRTRKAAREACVLAATKVAILRTLDA